MILPMIPRGLGLTELGYQFIGGIIKHGRALCAVFSPTVNSYKRLVRQGDMAHFLLGAGIQFLWFQQQHQLDARTDEWWAL